MIQRKTIELIGQDVRTVNPHKRKDIEKILKIGTLWINAPHSITKASFKDLEKSLSVYDEWMKSTVLKGFEVKKIKSAKEMHDKWQRSSILKGKSLKQIEQDLVFVKQGKSTPQRHISSKKLFDADATAKEWKKVFSSAKISELVEVSRVIGEWQKSSVLKNRTFCELEKDLQLASCGTK